MPVSCCAVGCTNRRTKDSLKKFFRFPSKSYEKERKKRWILALKREREDGSKWEPSPYMRVCSDHFQTGQPHNEINHPDYIPNLFCYKRKSNGINRYNRQKKRMKNTVSGTKQDSSYNEGLKEEILPTVDQNSFQEDIGKYEAAQTMLSLSLPSVSVQVDIPELSGITNNNEDILKLQAKIKEQELEIKHLKRKVQLLKNSAITIENIKCDDKAFKYYTGLSNYGVFKSLLDYFEPRAKNMKYWGSKFEVNITNEFKKKPGQNRNCSLEEEFLMVLVRLRLGMPLQEISRNFQSSTGSFSRIFTTWVSFLYFELKELSPLPKLSQIQTFMPESFREFRNTRIVIDTTEVRIQKAQSLKAQKQTFSSYKHYNTFKVLVGATPDGYIGFVSKLWGGNASDREIVLKSNLFSLLDAGDAIMCDKGFDIEAILPVGVKIHMPPFYKKKEGPMKAMDCLLTSRIASARVHIERVLRRVKEFHIWDAPLPLNMADIADQMFSVCAYLVNFQKPLINCSNFQV